MKPTLGCLARLSAVVFLLGCAQSLYGDATYYFSYSGAGFTDSGSAVSYTHLDVYKRQQQMVWVRRSGRQAWRVEDAKLLTLLALLKARR